MTEPELDDVMDEGEHPRPDHRWHAKTPPHLDDDELARLAEHEREVVERDRRQG